MEPTQISGATRMVLALSVALFLHTLILAGANSWPARAVEEPRPMQVVLASPDQGEISREAIQPAQPRDDAAPAEIAARPLQETITTTSATEIAPDNEQDDTDQREAEQQDPTPDPSPSESETASAPSPAVTAEAAGSRGRHEGSASISQLSEEETDNLSDYEQELWRLIAAEIRYDPVMADLRSPHQVSVELRLMDNGALQRVSITEPSGVEQLDRLARQAALTASPYPPPPPEERRGFRVQLHFMPQQGERD